MVSLVIPGALSASTDENEKMTDTQITKNEKKTFEKPDENLFAMFILLAMSTYWVVTN